MAQTPDSQKAPAAVSPWWQSSLLAVGLGFGIVTLLNAWLHWGLPAGGALALTAGLLGLWGLREVVLAARFGLHAAERGADLPYVGHLLQTMMQMKQIQDLLGGMSVPAGSTPTQTAESVALAAVDRVLRYFEARHAAGEASAAVEQTHQHEMNRVRAEQSARTADHMVGFLQQVPGLLQSLFDAIAASREPAPKGDPAGAAGTEAAKPAAEPASPSPGAAAAPAPAEPAAPLTPAASAGEPSAPAPAPESPFPPTEASLAAGAFPDGGHG